MKEHGKRLLAVLLALCMLGSLCLAAFATDEGGESAEPETKEITFNAGEGTINGAGSTSVTATKETMGPHTVWEFTTPAAEPVRTGYTFKTWKQDDNGEVSVGAGITTVIEDQTSASFTAQWEKKDDYDATFDPNGGTFTADNSTQSKSVKAGYDDEGDGWAIKLPAVTLEGKEFKGWLGGGNTYTKDPFIYTQITSFVAQWGDSEYKITFVTERGDKPSDMETVGGKLPTLPMLTASGYTFKGWFVGGKEYKGGETISEDITLTAKWETAASRPSNSGSFGGGGITLSYSVNSSTGTADNGSWSTDKASAKKGDTVTITLKPADGYQGVPTVKDSKGGNVAVTRKGENVYTFIMPEGNVTISAEFTAVVQAPAIPFVDVFPNEFYYDAMLWAVENGIAKGTGDGTTFSPNDSCTRAQAVTFLWRAAGEPEPTTTVNPFTDVKEDYYYKAMLWAVENKITTGTGDGTTFSPGAVVSRSQMVTFLWRAAGEPSAAEGGFTDIPANEYYADAVNWAASNGIAQGYNGAFSPNDNCTRGHIVTFLYRAQ